MPSDFAVVLDVAGTILKMYRVAKNIAKNILIRKVITWELIMEKSGRALVVPQLDPEVVAACLPKEPIGAILNLSDIEVSCSSSPVSKAEVVGILLGSKARIADIQEVHNEVKAKCPEKYQTTGMIVDQDIREVTYTISTAGTPFNGFNEVLESLKYLGAEVYVASGDSIHGLLQLTDYGILPERIFSASSPKRKQEIILMLKKKYKCVVMVGDGLNDIFALQASDLGILTLQQDTRQAPRLFKAADVVIWDIKELPEILKGRDV
ncbi:MAG: HAD family hydrolase [Methanotrichaceae archaeon]|nr:HAD family hydrolase [Methanotrichaceae archaeon]MDD1758108.1 HAD family hydrolase [Methanotrichaceae archaeon]